MGRATIERLSIDDEALWIEDGGRPRGYPLGSSALRQWLDDTRDRLNAVATIPDPAALVAAVRECVEALRIKDNGDRDGSAILYAALRHLEVCCGK